MRATSSPVLAALALAFLARPACAAAAPQETTMKETPQAAASGSPVPVMGIPWFCDLGTDS